MKKKMLCFFAAVLFGMLFLCSCGGGEDYPFTVSANEYWYEGYVYSMNTHCILTYRKASETEEIPLCFDPLCGHFMEDCPAFASGAREAMAVARNGDGQICIYYTDKIFHDDMPAGVWPMMYRLCCINIQTGEKTIILDEQSEEILDFILYGNHVYLHMRDYTENEEGKLVPTSIWGKMSLRDGNWIQLPTPEKSIHILAIAEVKGRTVLYWVESGTLYVSPEDFSENTKLFEGLSTYGTFVDGNYLYYPIKGTTTVPEMRVEAHPKEKNQNPDGTYTLYPELTLAAYYRMDVTDPHASPKLVYDGTSGFFSNDKLLWANGNKIYVIPHDPMLIEALDTYSVIDYVNTETNPLKIPVQYAYISARSGMKIIEIDLATGERREILTPGFDPQTIMGGNEENLVVRGEVVDIQRICDRIVEKGIDPGREYYTFREICEIPLNP